MQSEWAIFPNRPLDFARLGVQIAHAPFPTTVQDHRVTSVPTETTSRHCGEDGAAELSKTDPGASICAGS